MSENNKNPVSIDNIPNEILYQIISLIPLKEAARTIVLSSSWKHLWTPVKVSLNITSDQITSQLAGQQLNRIISSFLNTYNNCYQILNLSCLEPQSFAEETLFLKATKGVNNELCISFHGDNTKSFCLSINLAFNENKHFNYLRTLHLISITGVAGSFLTELFSDCRNLETLSIEKCNGLQDVNLKAHDMLQNFMILDCTNMVSVSISAASNLRSFVYRGTLVKIKLKEVPKLCDVTLNFKGISALCDYNWFDYEDIVHLLASLKDIKVLTLFGELLEWLCTRGESFDELGFKFDKLKELSLIDCCMNTQKRDSLACFLSITPSLERLFIKIDERLWSTIPSPRFHQSWPQLRINTSVVKFNDFQLKHLRMVKFIGFKIEGASDRILASLIDFLLKTAIAVKKMSVTEPENKLSWRVAKVPQSHLKRIASSSTRSCYSPKSCLLWSLDKECCFHLTLEDDS